MILDGKCWIRIWVGTSLLLVSSVFIGHGQAKKFHEFGNIRTSDAKAYLDLFAKRLLDDPDSSGALVAYYPTSWSPGAFLRHAHGYENYLINSCGIAPDRLTVVVGGTRNDLFFELWLIPKGSSLPVSQTDSHNRFAQLTNFDSLSFGSDCVSQYTVTLEEPGDAIRFFASSLQQNPTMKGLILIHPWRYQNDPEARMLLNSTIPRLVKEHSIPSDRLTLQAAEARYCGEVQFWVVPPDFVVPKGQTASTYLQSRLMAEAEGRYSVRRVEFVGIRYTRDHVLRREIPLIQEGEVFTKAKLITSLARVSRLSSIKPIRIRDVEAHLNRNELTIDLTLFFRERRLGRK